MVRLNDHKLARLAQVYVRVSKIPDLDIVSQMMVSGNHPPTVDSMVHDLKIPRTTLMRRLQNMEDTGAVVVNKGERHFEYQVASKKLDEVKLELSKSVRQILSIMGSWVIVINLFVL